MLNLSIGPHQSVTLQFHDEITVTNLSQNFTEVGFGLGAEQIERDSTHIIVQMTVLDGSQFIDLNPYPYDIVVESQEGSNYTYTWDAQHPYSPQLIYGITPEPIRAGFQIQMEVMEYYLPTVDPTFTSSPTTSPNNPLAISSDWSLSMYKITSTSNHRSIDTCRWVCFAHNRNYRLMEEMGLKLKSSHYSSCGRMNIVSILSTPDSFSSLPVMNLASCGIS